jgi:hypothetical protein
MQKADWDAIRGQNPYQASKRDVNEIASTRQAAKKV